MSGDWLGAALVLAWVFLFGGEGRQHPLEPWDKVGDSSRVYVVVENPEHDTLQVFARAPKVDDATRLIGVVLPCDSNFLRLPYVDTKVTLLDQYGQVLFVVEPTKPGIWRKKR